MTFRRMAVEQGWSIRGYAPGDIYADIYCPHGRPVEVINTAHEPIDPAEALHAWLAETAEWRSNYCEGHR